MKTTRILSSLTAVTILLVAPFAMAGRGDYETPNYKVVKNDGAFEVRDYSEMMVVSAPMKSADGNRNGAFRQLFGYISGKNETKQKIAMTTPVITSSNDNGGAMSFVVPQEVAQAGAPDANNTELVISKRSGGRFAVYRYSGRWTEARDKVAREKLIGWAKGQKLSVKGSVEKASYDPPFTLPAFRRNEVMVRIGK